MSIHAMYSFRLSSCIIEDSPIPATDDESFDLFIQDPWQV